MKFVPVEKQNPRLILSRIEVISWLFRLLQRWLNNSILRRRKLIWDKFYLFLLRVHSTTATMMFEFRLSNCCLWFTRSIRRWRLSGTRGWKDWDRTYRLNLRKKWIFTDHHFIFIQSKVNYQYLSLENVFYRDFCFYRDELCRLLFLSLLS